MSLAALTPGSTVSNTGAITGAASVHAAWSDASNSSYVAFDNGEKARVTLSDLALPAGAVIKSVRVVATAGRVGVVAVAMTATLYGFDGSPGDSVFIFTQSYTDYGVLSLEETGLTDAEADAAEVEIGCITGPAVLSVSELVFNVTYVTQPVVVVDAPTGTITDSNLPEVSWSETLDSDGGAAQAFEVKIGPTGFDPAVDTAIVESGAIEESGVTAWTVTQPLADGDYEAHVRIAQSVNGVLHWSEWDDEAFTIEVDLPGIPALALIPDPALGRIVVELSDSAGTVDTTFFELHRSYDGGQTWVGVRSLFGPPFIHVPTAGEIAVSDYEAPNGKSAMYRARAAHIFGSLTFSVSDWSPVDSETWSSTEWWIKHPTSPGLNMAVPRSRVYSQPGEGREARKGEHRVIGRPDLLIVSDVYDLPAGEITFELEHEAASLKDLLDTLSVLLVQAPAGDGWPDRWVSFGSQGSARLLDKLGVNDTHESLAWNEQPRPLTALVDEGGLLPAENLYPGDDLNPH